jgi:uncharacterized protein
MTTAEVSELWRYPVKSMLGERLQEAPIGEHGVVGDRAFALIDEETGKVCSAKRYDLWGDLFGFHAKLASSDPLASEITFPDGSVKHTDDPDISASLTGHFGREVRLGTTAPDNARIEEIWPEVKGPNKYGPPAGQQDGEEVIDVYASFASPGDFFDFSAIHLMTTNTIAELQRLEPQTRFDVRRFRPNVLVEVPGATGFVENGWSKIRIGEVELDVLMPVPRCVMTTLGQEDLDRDPGVLKAAAKHNWIEAGALGEMPCAGLYCSVASGGTVRTGDAVEAS